MALDVCESSEGQKLEAHLRQSQFNDFDTNLDSALEHVGQTKRNLELEGDLLYLLALRNVASKNLPSLPCFESTDQKTWAMCEGGEQWRQVGADAMFELQVNMLTPENLVDVRASITNGRNEYLGLLDAYFCRELGKIRNQLPSPDVAFAKFLQRCKQTVNKMLIASGGAGGHTTQNFAESFAASATGADLSADSPEAMEWLHFVSSLIANTRLGRADAFFSHMFFGICFRRLARRFDVMRSMGSLPAISGSAAARAKLERSVGADLESQDQATLAAQFESFAENIATPPEEDIFESTSALEQMLTISPSMLVAMRRKTSAFFGKGLRDELNKPMERVAEEIRDVPNPKFVDQLELTGSLLLEAANRGELRMLSASATAQERIAWHGILFGTFLHDAEENLSAAL